MAMLDLVVFGAGADPMHHLLQRDVLFDAIKLPDWMWMDWTHGGLGLSKPVIYMFFASALVFLTFTWLAKNFKAVPRGFIQSIFEPLLVFVRDIVRQQIKAPRHHDHNGHNGHDNQGHDHGEHEHAHATKPLSEDEQRKLDEAYADTFVPYFWTLFFFILFCNLLGLVPHSSTPTGQIGCTAALAFLSFVLIVGSGIRTHGPVTFLKNLVPPGIPMTFLYIIPNPIWLLVFACEFVGLFTKPFALCIRLMANMTGGHVVLFVLLMFAVWMQLFNPFYDHEITVPGGAAMAIPIALVSIIGAGLIGLLEVIVGLVQAYVFTLLTCTFIGMSINPEH